MSAAGRGAVRAPRDYYPTPAWCVHRLLDRVGTELLRTRSVNADPFAPPLWLEPCVGSGAIVDAVDDWVSARSPRLNPSWSLVDLRPKTKRPSIRANYLKVEGGAANFDVSITNPPFNLAEAFQAKMRREARVAALLLRLNFLGSIERAAGLQADMPDVFVLPNRPKFGRNKRGKVASDVTEYAWFVFGLSPCRTRSGRVEVLDVTPEHEIKRAADLLRRAA